VYSYSSTSTGCSSQQAATHTPPRTPATHAHLPAASNVIHAVMAPLLSQLAAAALVGSALGCNTAEELQRDITGPEGSLSHGGHGGLDRGVLAENAPLTLLPQDKGNESPACLDGSPYGFYFNPSKTGSTKWTISIEGGGWW
jgi:hypothetical protein